jgi:carbon-monoxide dehydrogenase small subunit
MGSDDDFSTRLCITVTVNGTLRSISAEARTSLADALRECLNLTGTHLGCEHGVCGAYTVLLDGNPVRSCTTLLASCSGREVTTIEGLSGPSIEALRDAFSAEHGLQCGFCTPGMLISAIDILRRYATISTDEAARELNGNLCRCTGYIGIIRAVCRASASLRSTTVE